MAKKGGTISEAHKKAMSEGMKNAFANGYKPTTDHLPKNFAHITKEQRQKAILKTSAKQRGRPQPLDKVTGAHENNKNGKEWHFKNVAKGVEIKGRNLSNLIREHAEHFNAEDTAKKHKGNCRAAICLRALTRKRSDTGKIRESWKGWSIV